MLVKDKCFRRLKKQKISRIMTVNGHKVNLINHFLENKTT